MPGVQQEEGIYESKNIHSGCVYESVLVSLFFIVQERDLSFRLLEVYFGLVKLGKSHQVVVVHGSVQ